MLLLMCAAAIWICGVTLLYMAVRGLRRQRTYAPVHEPFVSWVEQAVKPRRIGTKAPDVDEVEQLVEVLLVNLAPPRHHRVGADRPLVLR